MRRILALTVTATMVLVAATAAMAQSEEEPLDEDRRGPPADAGSSGKGQDQGQGRGNSSGGSDDDGEEASTSGSGSGGRGRDDDSGARGNSGSGTIASSWGGADGARSCRYSTFDIDDALPGITDYNVSGVLVLAEVALPEGDAENRTNGARFRMDVGESRIEVLCTPNALLKVRANASETAAITLAPGWTAEENPGDEDEDENHTVWVLTMGNETFLLSGRNITLEGNVFTVGPDGKAMLHRSKPLTSGGALAGGAGPSALGEEDGDKKGPSARALERRAAAMALRDSHREDIEHGIASGDVAVEVYVEDEEGEDEPLSVEYAHVNVLKARGKQGDKVAGLEIESDDHDRGTLVILNFAPGAFDNMTLDEIGEMLSVHFDGAEVGAADDFADLMNPKDDGGIAEYLVLVGEDRIRVAVSVPDFSVHSIEVFRAQNVAATLVEVAGSPLAVLAGALAAIAVVGATAYWRRR